MSATRLSPERFPLQETRTGTVRQLCLRAANSPGARELYGGWAECRVEATSDPRLRIFVVMYATWTSAYLAERHGDRLTLIARVDEMEDRPDGHQYLTYNTVNTWWSSDGQAFFVETEMSFTDFDPGWGGGREWRTRHISMCFRDAPGRELRCDLRVPTFAEFGLFDTDPNDPFRVTAHHLVRNEAIVVLRPDGRLRFTLRAGTWVGLFQFAWNEPALPSANVHSEILDLRSVSESPMTPLQLVSGPIF